MNDVAVEKKAVVTLTMGEFYTKMSKYTHCLIDSYAKKHNADFIILDTPVVSKKYDLPTKYEKFQLYDLLDNYDRILFIDTDILVSPMAPNVFEMFDDDHFVAVTEEVCFSAQRDRKVTQKIMGAVNWGYPYFNSGFMLVSRKHKEMFNPNDEFLKHWATGEFRKNHINLLNDQPFLNHKLNKLQLPYKALDQRFNHTVAYHKSHTRFNSFFIHYSGPSGHRYGERLEQIRLDAKILSNANLVNFYAKHIRLRWVLDRVHEGFLLKYWKLLTNKNTTKFSEH